MDYIIYDIIIAAVLLFFLWRGYRRGLVLTLCSLLAVFVALIGASILSNTLADPVAKAIEPVVASSIHDTVTSYYQQGSEAGASSPGEEDWLAQLPLEELLRPLKESRAFQGFADTFQKAVDSGVADAAAHAAQALAHFAAVQIARTAIFSVAFIAVLIAWNILSHALDLVTRLPVLNGLNRWTGAAVGLVKGAAIVFIAVWLLRSSYIPPEAAESTLLLRAFYTAGLPALSR